MLPTVLGHDGRLQFVHEDDALEAIRLATLGDVTGAVNVAGDGVLGLGQAARMAGRPSVGVAPGFTRPLAQVFRRTGLVDFSGDQVRFLSYGRVLDTTRMRADLGLEPAYTSREAFADLIRGQQMAGPLSAPVVQDVERRLRAGGRRVLRAFAGGAG